MEITGSYTFAAPPARVWALLMDPTAIAGCIPGCEGLTPAGEGRYTARIKVGIGAITGSYQGSVAMSDVRELESYRLTVDGKGAPGFVKGDAVISLRADGDRTIVDVAGQVQTGGAIARLGQRLIGSAAKMMQDNFFACMGHRLATD
jgi:carbon monoxide dehydrogenase subunit G